MHIQEIAYWVSYWESYLIITVAAQAAVNILVKVKLQ